MNKVEQEQLKFYKNGQAEVVLKRFAFSEDEEKLIRDAIRTSKMQHPRMKLIEQADELLKEVAKTRKPIVTGEVDNQEVAKTVAKVSAPYIKRFLPHIPWWMWVVIIALIVNTGKISHYISQIFYKYTYSEAKEYCKKRGKILPKSVYDLYKEGKNVPQGISIWSKDGQLLNIMAKIPDDGQKHFVICVDKRENSTGY